MKMARKNIFEILAEKVDIQQQLEKIEELCRKIQYIMIL